MSSLPLLEFPECRHAEAPRSQEVRRCLCPAIVGRRLVGPATCRDCNYRDRSVPQTAPPDFGPLAPCVWLGRDADFGGKGRSGGSLLPEGVFACGHPAYDVTTRAQCAVCPDYLSRELRPDLPVERIEVLLDQPPYEQPYGWWGWPRVQEAQRRLAERAIARTPPFPGTRYDRGIVVVGGGKYLVSAYVTIRVLRHVGCRLPIELWHLADEVDSSTRALLAAWDVECIDAEALTEQHPFRFLNHWWRGWQLKAYALQHASFREVLLLDADSYPVRNPQFLFDWPAYLRTGAVFWPDAPGSAALLPDAVWEVFGAAPTTQRPNESGQMLVNREACWKEVCLAAHYNAHADFAYRYVYGDKDTFLLAWRRMERDFARMWPECQARMPGLLQLDDRGEVLFQHRIHDKFRLPGTHFSATPQMAAINRFYPHFAHELFCFQVLEELAEHQTTMPIA